MSTLSQLVYNIKGIIREINDDTDLSNEQLIHMINYCRSTLIRRDVGKGRTINPQIEQPLGCLELELVDKAECCDIETNCYILKTKLEIPKLVEGYNKNLLTYVGSVDNTTDFQFISSARSRWTKYNKYTSKESYPFMRGNHLYIVHEKVLSHIAARGVFEDPRAVAQFKHCDGKPCFKLTDEYPLPMWMEQTIGDMLRKGELNMYFNVQEDKTNDSDDRTKPTTKAN